MVNFALVTLLCEYPLASYAATASRVSLADTATEHGLAHVVVGAIPGAPLKE